MTFIRLAFVFTLLSLFGHPASAHDASLHFVPPSFERSSDLHFYDKWLGNVLNVFGETSIWASTLTDEYTHSYRITKIPSIIGMPVTVRVDLSKDGSSMIVIHDPNIEKLEKNFDTRSSEAEFRLAIKQMKRTVVLPRGDKRISEIRHLIKESGFWTERIDGHERKDAIKDSSYLDGNGYFIEGGRGKNYKVVVRHGCWIEYEFIALIEMIARDFNVERLGKGCSND